MEKNPLSLKEKFSTDMGKVLLEHRRVFNFSLHINYILIYRSSKFELLIISNQKIINWNY